MTTSDYIFGIGWILTGLDYRRRQNGHGAFGVDPKVWGKVPHNMVEQYHQALIVWQKQMVSKIKDIENKKTDVEKLATATWYWWHPNQPVPAPNPYLAKAQEWLKIRNNYSVLLAFLALPLLP